MTTRIAPDTQRVPRRDAFFGVRCLISSGANLSRRIPFLPSQSICFQQAQRLAILLGGAREYVSGQRRRGRALVPRLCLQPVADELLVEAGWTDARAVFGRRPEARRVRRQSLVDE